MGSGKSGLYQGTVPLIEPAHIDEMTERKVNFTEENIIMTVKDRDGNLMWLESGNESAGLQHILYGNMQKPGHIKDFKDAFGIPENLIPAHMKLIISTGTLISTKERPLSNGRTGLERIYSFDGNFYLLTGVGTNGFIVTAYPIKIKQN